MGGPRDLAGVCRDPTHSCRLNNRGSGARLAPARTGGQ